MPRSPQWMDLYQIWFRVSSRGRNQLCRILLQSAHGFRFCEGSKFAISHWLGWSPLTQCWRYRAACDQWRVLTCKLKVTFFNFYNVFYNNSWVTAKLSNFVFCLGSIVDMCHYRFSEMDHKICYFLGHLTTNSFQLQPPDPPPGALPLDPAGGTAPDPPYRPALPRSPYIYSFISP